MKQIVKSLGFLAALLPSLAAAQTIPANTVVGRMGISPGPSQAIPFSVLAPQLATAGHFTFGPATTTVGHFAVWNNAIGSALADHVIQGSDLPTPSATTLGAVKSLTCSTSNWFQTLSTSGVFGCSQPNFTDLAGSLVASQLPALTGDVTTPGGSLTTTLATVNSNVGSFGSSTSVPNFTVDGKGRITAAGSNSIPTGSAVVKGLLQTDGATITNSSGVISVTPATTSQLGGVKPDGTTITASGGVISAVGGVATSVQPGTTTVTGGTNGKCLGTNGSAVMNQISCPDLTASGQTLSGGAIVTTQSLTTGSITVDCSTRPLQQITNGGAFTITAPANDGSCVIKITNNASAGAVTFSGFSVGSNSGDALTTTNLSKFFVTVVRVGGDSTYFVKALQ